MILVKAEEKAKGVLDFGIPGFDGGMVIYQVYL